MQPTTTLPNAYGRAAMPCQRVCKGRTVWQPCSPVTSVAQSKVSATSHSRSSSSSGSGSSSSSSSSKMGFHNRTMGFHNRTVELAFLEQHLSRTPQAITVLVGPPSAGKSALLQQYMAQRGPTGSRCLIDARETPVSTPGALASQLLRVGLPQILQPLFPHTEGWFSLLKAAKDALNAAQDKLTLGGSVFTINGTAITALLGFLPPGKEDIAEAPLAAVIAAYTTLLDVWQQEKQQQQQQLAGKLTDASPPVLVLDEAHVLMRWGEQYKAEQQDLLSFFVAISKARGRSHVLLATSDCSFLTWLSKEIGPGCCQIYVVGDFTAQDARQFLDKRLRQLGRPEISAEDWGQVYAVCGGNAGTLGQVADCFADLGSWQPALLEVAKDMWSTIRPGYMPAADAGYTAADYATAVRAILHSPHHAVDAQMLAAVLGGQSLGALVQANLLAVRSYSFWASDISPDAFGPRRLSAVVTAPTALHLYLMRVNEQRLLAALNGHLFNSNCDARLLNL